ncbi:M20 family metallopeptidase [Deinococcus sp. QL22]|uniref:M20 family metallopeptidase n=1 Tax=Deinococcus sp. QL22 TaxID=2939437 RepID=UPI0020173EA9|nr:M20 family metallopeptidase [Deinococcus sp. QL22]UQN08214.1 M20 family metallopeptidase [Deinococcus sp. QL22]
MPFYFRMSLMTTLSMPPLQTYMQPLQQQLIDLSLDIHAHPETAWQEHHAVEGLTTLLESHGLQVERNFCNLPTSFRASHTFGVSGPTITLLAEYDALPGLGHACSHNIIGVAAAGAAILVKQALEGTLFAGRIEVVGCPAEEGGGGKIILLDHGAFQATDAAMMIHGGARSMPVRSSLALADLNFKFYGRASHAASNPHLGVNALDACIQTFNAINAMRQHFPDETRVHGIITHGGAAANIVPDYAEADFLVRHKQLEVMRDIKAKVRRCAEFAAAAVGARVEITEDREYTSRNNNVALATRFGHHLQALGEDLQAPPQIGGVGSSDFNNVSHQVPAIHPYIKIAPEGTSAHTIEFLEASRSPEGMRGLLLGAQALASTAIDLLQDPHLLQQVKSEFAVNQQGLSSDAQGAPS